MTFITHFRDHLGAREDKHYKTTLFQGAHMMVGINCLEPGQIQPVHDHADADKVYVVMEGRGVFTIGDVVQEAGSGEVIWAPAGIPHGVENHSTERLTLLVGISPSPVHD